MKRFSKCFRKSFEKIRLSDKIIKIYSGNMQRFKRKDLPLLDVITNENTLINENINQTELKTDIKKIFDYFKPIKTVVLGYRVDQIIFLSFSFGFICFIFS